MTTGICLSIVAGAAEEQIAAGRRPVAPYWRVVEADGSLRNRNPAGPLVQARHLRLEGHRVTKERGREIWRVEGFRAR
jgi:alkylated DNA nucleotide flippase Atl1